MKRPFHILAFLRVGGTLPQFVTIACTGGPYWTEYWIQLFLDSNTVKLAVDSANQHSVLSLEIVPSLIMLPLKDIIFSKRATTQLSCFKADIL